jgi:hypothetical protein
MDYNEDPDPSCRSCEERREWRHRAALRLDELELFLRRTVDVLKMRGGTPEHDDLLKDGLLLLERFQRNT